jgi:DNA-binding NarL/FixJ family response regulator
MSSGKMPSSASGKPTSIRVLVMDDYGPWCRFVCSALQQQAEFEFQVVGEVADGLEAVEKARELQPDLILLDIGLPTLNGIEVARRIRQVSPESKILFASQESSADVVQAALSVGARGYVVKVDAGTELLTAANAVVRGERFIGSRFASSDFTGASDSPHPRSIRRNKVPAPFEAQNVGITRRHEVGLYSDDGAFLDGFADFIAAALKVGKAVILIATESHRNCLLQKLQAGGVDVSAAVEQQRYISLDVAASLPTFISPNPVRFAKGSRPLLVEAAKAATDKHPHVAVG